VASVEVRRNGFGGKDADAGRKAAVERALEIGGRDGRSESDRGDLPERMHSGIGSAGTLRQDALADGAADGIGEQTLNGG